MKSYLTHLNLLAQDIGGPKYYPMVRQVFFRFLSLLYTGNQVICPWCGGHFRKFYEFRGAPVCPGCGTRSRHRLLWLYLKNRTNFFSDDLTLLYMAPMYILQKVFSSLSNLNYISADLDSPLAIVKMDVTNISYGDNSFDVILCNHLLEHVIDDHKAMKELFRVLNPGGWAILQIPIDLKREKTFEDPTIVSPEDRERFFGQYDHMRLYGRDYKDRLEKAGFAIKVDTYVTDLGPDMIKKYGLMKDEDIYFCTKPNPRKD